MLTHQVSRVSFSEGTDVQFAELPEQVVRAYIETGEPMDKAGGYGIQVAAFFEENKAKAISAELLELNFGQIQWYFGQIQFFFGKYSGILGK